MKTEDLGLVRRIARRLDLGLDRGNADGSPQLLISAADARTQALQQRNARASWRRPKAVPLTIEQTRKPGRTRAKREAARQRARGVA